MAIRELPPNLVNRIAAGEVVERPASVVKELIENAIDAGASRIDILASAGGLGVIRVTDDGAGMDASDLALCGRAPRHLQARRRRPLAYPDARLPRRGSALDRRRGAARHPEPRARRAPRPTRSPSTAARRSALRPAALSGGTRVEVRDLFYATPARLKFMKSERAESAAIADMVKRLALAKPEIAFSLANGERTTLQARGLPARADRSWAGAARPHPRRGFRKGRAAGARLARRDRGRRASPDCRRCIGPTPRSFISR